LINHELIDDHPVLAHLLSDREKFRRLLANKPSKISYTPYYYDLGNYVEKLEEILKKKNDWMDACSKRLLRENKNNIIRNIALPSINRSIKHYVNCHPETKVSTIPSYRYKMKRFQERNRDFFSVVQLYNKKATPRLESKIQTYLNKRSELRAFTDSLNVSKDIYKPGKVMRVIGKKMSDNIYAAHKCLKKPAIRMNYQDQKIKNLENKIKKQSVRRIVRPRSIFRRIKDACRSFYYTLKY